MKVDNRERSHENGGRKEIVERSGRGRLPRLPHTTTVNSLRLVAEQQSGKFNSVVRKAVKAMLPLL